MHDVPGEVRVLHAFDAVELSGSAPRLNAGRIDAGRQVHRQELHERPSCDPAFAQLVVETLIVARFIAQLGSALASTFCWNRRGCSR